MKRKVLLSVVVLIIVFSCLTFVPETKSAEYPDKPIEFVVMAPPGGPFDNFVRVMALLLNDEGIVKPKINIFNKTGGGATVSLNYLASKKGDPNVLYAWTVNPVVTVLRGTTTVKDVMDLTQLCSLMEDPNLLAVRADSKYKNLKELIEDSKKNPDKVKAGIGNVGGGEHIIMTRIEQATGVRFSITSFGGTGHVALLGGHVDFTITGPSDVMQSVAAGKLRILAAVGDTRIQEAPDVPTMKEQGVNVSFRQLRGFWGPPEMPAYAVKFWDAAFAKLAVSKGFEATLTKLAMMNAYMGQEQLTKFMPSYVAEFAQDLKNLEVYGGKKK